MTTLRAPSGLAAKGRKLWKDVTSTHTLAAPELVLLEEACRIADRLDKLDALLSGEVEHWVDLRAIKGCEEAVEIHIDSALSEARQQANVLKQLIASLRLPDDATGKKPQQRGGARGSYAPKASAPPAGVVSSLDRARARRGG